VAHLQDQFLQGTEDKMSFAINPNPPQSQSVVSHNNVDAEADLEKKSSDDTLMEREDIIEAQVGELARQLTRKSTRFSTNGGLQNPFSLEDPESSLNPHSPNFRARDWIKMLLELRSQDPVKFPEKQAGISFRNLSVHGFGSPTDYQKNVLNSLLEIGTLVRRAVGVKMQRVQILRDFEGLVKSGEMLVVLGRPGSGCSTLLKTIAGEMNGINMSEESVVNYQGMYFYLFVDLQCLTLCRCPCEGNAQQLQR
jgi:ABC-type multidrug transport system fused ATPase/permease subunit